MFSSILKSQLVGGSTTTYHIKQDDKKSLMKICKITKQSMYDTMASLGKFQVITTARREIQQIQIFWNVETYLQV